MSQVPTPPKELLWHYMIGAQQLGPAPTSVMLGMIRSGAITASTMVWRDGLAGWIPAGVAAEFAFAFTKAKSYFPDAKSKMAAGLLGVFLGGFGVHRFYLGYVGIGIAQILVTVFTCGLGWIWGFIEGILILTGTIDRDAEGKLLKE